MKTALKVKSSLKPKIPTSGIQEVAYFSERYPDRESLDQEVDYWDASTAGDYAWCPRKAQYSHRMGLRESEEALTLLTGSAIHAGLAVLYTSNNEDLALQACVESFGDREPPPPSHSYAHLHAGFVEAVFKNYMVWRRKHDVFTPLIVHLEELDLTDVAAAVWRVLPDERVILAESKFIMKFLVDGEEFLYAMRPDLPITLGGNLYAYDSKVSCGGYLSDWYFEKFLLSNQLRGYNAGLQKLLKKKFAGALINGIYAGEKALETRTPKGQPSKVTKFTRYGPLKFTQDHLQEALWNQYVWRQLAFVHQELADQHKDLHKKFGYAQNTGKSCQGCSYLMVCQTEPRARFTVLGKKFTQKRHHFLDL